MRNAERKKPHRQGVIVGQSKERFPNSHLGHLIYSSPQEAPNI